MKQALLFLLWLVAVGGGGLIIGHVCANHHVPIYAWTAIAFTYGMLMTILGSKFKSTKE
jgi:hypothetical protein